MELCQSCSMSSLAVFGLRQRSSDLMKLVAPRIWLINSFAPTITLLNMIIILIFIIRITNDIFGMAHGYPVIVYKRHNYLRIKGLGDWIPDS